MNGLESFIGRLRERLTRPLPGALAHEVMRARPIGNFRPGFDHKTPPKPGSVLILLYPQNGKLYFPLTLRADYAGAHSGQVSLPGGKAEAGETFVDTALRECEEEIGVGPEGLEVLGRLSDFFVIPSNFLVVPVIAISHQVPVFKADPVEVARILIGSVEDLLLDNASREKEILAAAQFPMIAPHFDMDGEVVWGATAMMLNEFRWILREIS